MGETLNSRAIGPFQVPGGDFGPQTNGNATPAMPGFITPPQPQAPAKPQTNWWDERPDYGRRFGMKYGPRNPLLL